VENEWEGWSGQDYIHPKETRSKIIKTLKLLEGKKVEIGSRKHDNMPL
jgi:acetyl-CoA carboxylase carboxyltransferase component